MHKCDDMNYDKPTPDTDLFLAHIDDSEIDMSQVAAQMRYLECERDEARRQVDAIIGVIAPNLCPPNNPCFLNGEHRCIKCWSAWAAQQAKEGGGR